MTRAAIDLSDCEREPIRAPGSIQPHGALVVLHEPDLVVTAASRDVATAHGIPAIALTGFGMEHDVARSYAAGFAEHITKPMDLEKLTAAIQRLTTSSTRSPS